MIRKAYLTLVFLLVVCAGAFAQSGAIRGKILDKANKQPIPFATVVAEMNGTQVSGGQSDFDGEYNSNGFLFHNLGQTFILEANIINGDLVLNENQINTILKNSLSYEKLQANLENALGISWDLELEPYRLALATPILDTVSKSG